jgi:Cu+-exporting ATPase
MSEATKQTQLQISGMTCAACAARIEKGLRKLEGVENANVNIALEKSTIQYDPTKVNIHQFQQKIRDLGYDVVMEKMEFTITGMTCAACATRIEKGLNKLEGIEQANVNLALEHATITYQSGVMTPEDIIKKVDKLGYGAILKEDEQEAYDYRQEEIKKQKRKLMLSAILTLPLLWSMVSHFTFTSFIYVPDILMNPWIQLLIATPIQFLIGAQFYIGAYKALSNKSANMDVLVALGTSAAYFYSVYEVIRSIGMVGHSPKLYFETSAVLITLIILGKLFEAKAKGRSSEAIKKLMGLQATTAIVIREGEEAEIPLNQVIIGDIVSIKPGEKVPLDGIIVEGRSAVDESMITGESLPVDKIKGDTVIGATINRNGSLKVEVTKVGGNTILSSIIKIVEDAQGSKAPIQRLADQISGIFVPIVVSLAIITFIIWYVWVSPGELSVSLEKLIAVLVIACPCALGLATPTSIMAGSGRSAEMGILFKGGEHLEATHKVDTIVLDKTGTVTNGAPILTDLFLVKKWNGHDVESLVLSAESQSEHPLGQAIVMGLKEKGVPTKAVQAFEALPGFGVKAMIDFKEVLIGTRNLMKQHDINVSEVNDQMVKLEKVGKTAMLLSIDREYVGLVAVADTIKGTSKLSISRLKQMGLEVVMITGDNVRTAQAMAQEAGIDRVIAEVLPEEKANEVKKLQQEGKRVAMVGDGINDAPALVVADIGMAIGTGADIAIEAADITLIRGDLMSIADAIEMSKRTMRNIKQNLFWAFAYNVIGIPIAAIGLLAPWIAGAAMAFSSVSVVLNALRLQKVKL